MEELVADGVAFASAHGFLYGDAKDPSRCHHAPMTLLPTPLRRSAFVHALELTCPYNLLVDKVARDVEWILSKLEGVLENDAFTARLVELCKSVESKGVSQRTYLGILRSDYMLDNGADLLQIELNTIASSFGCLSSRVSRLHRFLIERYAETNNVVKNRVDSMLEGKSSFDVNDHLPRNVADTAIPSALARAAKYYTQEYGSDKSGATATVLFVVQKGERNAFDQRWLEYELWSAHGVKVLRLSLDQVLERGSLKGDRGELFIGDSVVGVVYFRAGYTPDDYPGQAEWDARLLIERSLAIKCPSIQYHLVGTKKIQQELARPGAVERFLDAETADLLRSSFAGLWSLDAKEQVEEDKSAMSRARQEPDAFVIKPQREGGGNNIYGDQVKEALDNFSPEELASYILMQRIVPQEVDATLVRTGNALESKALQELGVYGTFLGNGEKVIFTEQAGHLLRTKSVGVDEGGVATGYSCLDSPFLT